MANPASREQLKQYALRILGKPVIEINVDDDQLEDRLDEALQYFAQYHYDGVERTYLKYKVTQADVDRQTTDVEAQTSSKTASKVTNTFTGDGTTSVFTLGTAADNAAALTVKLDGVANTAFTVSGTTLTMTEGAVPNGVAIEVTIQNTVSTPWQEQPNYIICPEPVLAVNRIFPLSNRGNQSPLATSNLPLRAGKGHNYEGGIKVPLFLVWEDKIVKGWSNTVVTGTDHFPTLLELINENKHDDKHIDGVSFKKSLIGDNQDLSLIHI